MEIQYGKRYVEDTIVAGKTIRTVRRCTERFKIEKKTDALSMQLRLDERWRKGEISEPGSKIIEKDGEPSYIELYWVEVV